MLPMNFPFLYFWFRVSGGWLITHGALSYKSRWWKSMPTGQPGQLYKVYWRRKSRAYGKRVCFKSGWVTCRKAGAGRKNDENFLHSKPYPVFGNAISGVDVLRRGIKKDNDFCIALSCASRLWSLFDYPGTHCKYRIGEFTPLLSCVELTVNIRGEFYEWRNRLWVVWLP